MQSNPAQQNFVQNIKAAKDHSKLQIAKPATKTLTHSRMQLLSSDHRGHVESAPCLQIL